MLPFQYLWFYFVRFFVVVAFPIWLGGFIGIEMGLSLNGTLIPMAITTIIWIPFMGWKIGHFRDGAVKTVGHVIFKTLSGISRDDGGED